eukprot:2573014-Rhodomonas_salina.3
MLPVSDNGQCSALDGPACCILLQIGPGLSLSCQTEADIAGRSSTWVAKPRSPSRRTKSYASISPALRPRSARRSPKLPDSTKTSTPPRCPGRVKADPSRLLSSWKRNLTRMETTGADFALVRAGREQRTEGNVPVAARGQDSGQSDLKRVGAKAVRDPERRGGPVGTALQVGIAMLDTDVVDSLLWFQGWRFDATRQFLGSIVRSKMPFPLDCDLG